MKALKCDRCNKFYDTYKGKKLNDKGCHYNGMALARDNDYNYLSRKEYELCPDCMEELIKFIKKETENGE